MASVGDGRCDCGTGRVVDARSWRGRRDLRYAVWGSEKRQSRVQAIGRAGATGTGIGAMVEGVDCALQGDPDFMGFLVVVAAATAVFAGAAALIIHARDRLRDRKLRAQLRPYGARGAPALASAGGAGRPRVGSADGEPFPSPLRRETCLAFEISLRMEAPHSAAADLVWREAATTGLSVRLDDGEIVRIPAGPIRLSRPPDSARVSHGAARARLPAELAERDVGLPYVPSDMAFEHVIRPGDRVAVVGPLEPHEDDSEPSESLRSPARRALFPVGTPVVATLDD